MLSIIFHVGLQGVAVISKEEKAADRKIRQIRSRPVTGLLVKFIDYKRKESNNIITSKQNEGSQQETSKKSTSHLHQKENRKGNS